MAHSSYSGTGDLTRTVDDALIQNLVLKQWWQSLGQVVQRPRTTVS